jgi:uncharacterized repeat protein (TIGR03803 family)
MKSTKRSAALRTAVAFAAITLGLAVCAPAQTFTTLASFDAGNGSDPQYGSLVQGTDGNYYGTTPAGGHYGAGVFFRVTPSGELTNLYNFCSLSKCSDGESPGPHRCSALTETSTGPQVLAETAKKRARFTG